MRPDRTLADEGRFIHDMRDANLGCDKLNHPPAKLPTHREIARTILWWRCRCPKVRVYLAKRDFQAAFKLLWVELPGLRIMAVSLLGVRGTEPITVIYLAMVFGWTGAPGEWAVWGRGVQDAHQAHCPPEADLHDEVAYSSEVLVDDGVLVEPALGIRPWLSAWTFDAMSKLILGDGAINLAKLAEEGEFSTEKLIWGLQFQLEDVGGRVIDQATLPEAKIQKMRFLLQEAEAAEEEDGEEG